MARGVWVSLLMCALGSERQGLGQGDAQVGAIALARPAIPLCADHVRPTVTRIADAPEAWCPVT